MTLYLGDFAEDATVDFKWSTNGVGGESITRGTNGTVSVYVGNSTSQLTSGVTDTEDFDSLTGVHHCRIDLSASATYATGSECQVVLSAAAIDGETVNAVLAHFSIERAGGALALLKGASGLSAIKTQTGAIETDTQNIQSRLPTSLVSGRIDASVGAMEANTITNSALATSAVTEIQSGLATSTALATVDQNVDDILTDTGTTIPGLIGDLNNISEAEVNAQVDAAIETYRLDELVAAAASSPAAGSFLGDLVEDDGGTFRFTENALEEAPTGGSAPTAEEIRQEMDSNSTQLAAIVEDTGTTLPGTLSGLATATDLATVDNVVDAIKAKTDQLTFTVAGKADANIEAVNGAAIDGTGTEADPWGPA